MSSGVRGRLSAIQTGIPPQQPSMLNKNCSQAVLEMWGHQAMSIAALTELQCSSILLANSPRCQHRTEEMPETTASSSCTGHPSSRLSGRALPPEGWKCLESSAVFAKKKKKDLGVFLYTWILYIAIVCFPWHLFYSEKEGNIFNSGNSSLLQLGPWSPSIVSMSCEDIRTELYLDQDSTLVIQSQISLLEEVLQTRCQLPSQGHIRLVSEVAGEQ